MCATLDKGSPAYGPYSSVVCAAAKDPDITQDEQSLLVRLPGVCLQCDTSDSQSLFLEASQKCTTEAERDIYYDYHIMMLPIFHG